MNIQLTTLMDFVLHKNVSKIKISRRENGNNELSRFYRAHEVWFLTLLQTSKFSKTVRAMENLAIHNSDYDFVPLLTESWYPNYFYFRNL